MPREERKGERRVSNTAPTPTAIPIGDSTVVTATVTPRRVTIPSPPLNLVKIDFQWPATAAPPARISALSGTPRSLANSMAR